MLNNIYLTLIEPINGSDTIMKMDAVPSFGKLNSHQSWVKSKAGCRSSGYNYAQVSGSPDTRVYMGIIAQYDTETAQFTILEDLMRNTRINLALLKECAPIMV